MKNKHINININIKNKKASFEYSFLDSEIAGIMLNGSEVKSIKSGNANIVDAYIQINGNEVLLRKMYIAPFEHGGYSNHEPTRDRKLLLTKKQIKKWYENVKTSGTTIIPYRVFIDENGKIKVDIKLAKGKKLYDKKMAIKEKELDKKISNYFKE
jgi:SsrA-binding protein